MNRYIPVLAEHPPEGFIGNHTWEHKGTTVVNGHTPPRTMELDCPCIWCLVDSLGQDLDRYVLGPVWISNMEFVDRIPELVGVYARPPSKEKENN